MGMADRRVRCACLMLEMYVPLKATSSGRVRDLGRAICVWPAASSAQKRPRRMGQRVSEPLPVLDPAQQHDGLVVLGDPGSGKTTFPQSI